MLTEIKTLKPERPAFQMTRRYMVAGICILAVQVSLTAALSRHERTFSPPPLADFPTTLGPVSGPWGGVSGPWGGVSGPWGGWISTEELTLAPDVIEMLGPDDFLNRNYRSTSQNIEGNLFIAYYKTQHGLKTVHDPKVCLPASGWNPKASATINIPVSPSGATIPVNYYLIAKGSVQSVVLYWFQSHKRVVAQEQVLHFDRVIDTIVDNRTDMAMIRIVVPVRGDAIPEAKDAAIRFAALIYPQARKQFPQ
jgi:EpsI family protein